MNIEPWKIISDFMNIEYWKIIIAAVLGFITAVFTEPIKNHFSVKVKKKQIRIGLYKEITSIYEGLRLYLRASENNPQSVSILDILGSDFSCYEYAKKEPVIFYQLREATLINLIYQNITTLKQKDDSIHPEKKIHLIKAVLDQIDFITSSSSFNGKLFRRLLKDLRITKKVRQKALSESLTQIK
ncbi:MULTISPECIES: hypothetical protein [Leptolyngbya]|uniref:hypothetical protein n=1 Tax=Leptolyngbya TaxID=47251 RepID=UPI00168569AF|nr:MULTISPECIES: hypothetical protein [unclassified Leptolyngbya]MBD1856458.1 hypothetical protein [Leptolyngbya sp. FACHB-1624]MBN8564124.1 hypothetical protein [Leptolyngbya sp. UWPOB_LEPTO1]